MIIINFLQFMKNKGLTNNPKCDTIDLFKRGRKQKCLDVLNAEVLLSQNCCGLHTMKMDGQLKLFVLTYADAARNLPVQATTLAKTAVRL